MALSNYDYYERIYNYTHGLTNSAGSQNDHIEHSAEGQYWDQHKYIRKEYLGNGNWRYIYEDGSNSVQTANNETEADAKEAQRVTPAVNQAQQARNTAAASSQSKATSGNLVDQGQQARQNEVNRNSIENSNTFLVNQAQKGREDAIAKSQLAVERQNRYKNNINSQNQAIKEGTAATVSDTNSRNTFLQGQKVAKEQEQKQLTEMNNRLREDDIRRLEEEGSDESIAKANRLKKEVEDEKASEGMTKLTIGDILGFTKGLVNTGINAMTSAPEVPTEQKPIDNANEAVDAERMPAQPGANDSKAFAQDTNLGGSGDSEGAAREKFEEYTDGLLEIFEEFENAGYSKQYVIDLIDDAEKAAGLTPITKELLADERTTIDDIHFLPGATQELQKYINDVLPLLSVAANQRIYNSPTATPLPPKDQRGVSSSEESKTVSEIAREILGDEGWKKAEQEFYAGYALAFAVSSLKRTNPELADIDTTNMQQLARAYYSNPEVKKLADEIFLQSNLVSKAAEQLKKTP